jgi:hypothetical protein
MLAFWWLFVGWHAEGEGEMAEYYLKKMKEWKNNEQV